MIKEIVNELSEEQLKKFIDKFIDVCEKECPDVVQKAIMETYYDIYGCHFNETMLKLATKDMMNEDGTKGAKWSVADTTTVARNYGITFDHFNEYDWNYVMNMMYSDYYGAVTNEVSSYYKLAKSFLCDKDAQEGKAIKYYFAMHKQ